MNTSRQIFRMTSLAAIAIAITCALPGPACAEPLDETSIYQLDSSWTRADGEAVALPSLRGKVRVIAIFYASCQYACPILVGRMKTLDAALPERLRDQVGYVLVTMDPAPDTPAKLRDSASRLELRSDWALLHGADDDVRELAALLGFRYRREADGGYSHSNMVTVLDREGRIASQSIGLDADVSDLIRSVTGLLLP
jgi:protein SCO1